ncbi:MAG: 3-keto-disaccharide hydrolase [Pirellulales bacterium]
MNYERGSVLVRTAVCGALLVAIGVTPAVVAADVEEGFVNLFDGKSLAGWKANENTASWSVVDGAIVCHGPRSHLFYVGSDEAKPESFRNFHLKAEVMTKPVANSGLFIHTAFQPDGWPAQGYEVQVNNTFRHDPVRTGSLYNVVKILAPPAKDNEWFTLEVMVNGKAVGVAVDGRVLYEFVEPEGVTGTRKLSQGTFALQAHDPGSEVHYRSIKVKRLP